MGMAPDKTLEEYVKETPALAPAEVSDPTDEVATPPAAPVETPVPSDHNS
jgi:hypothetical protein